MELFSLLALISRGAAGATPRYRVLHIRRLMCRDTLQLECEQMIVYQNSIAFTAIPKHASFYVQTAEIPLAMLEAAATSASTTRV